MKGMYTAENAPVRNAGANLSLFTAWTNDPQKNVVYFGHERNMIHAKSQRLKTKKYSKKKKKILLLFTSKASLNKMARETMNG